MLLSNGRARGAVLARRARIAKGKPVATDAHAAAETGRALASLASRSRTRTSQRARGGTARARATGSAR
jgi:hypothetical protein